MLCDKIKNEINENYTSVEKYTSCSLSRRSCLFSYCWMLEMKFLPASLNGSLKVSFLMLLGWMKIGSFGAVGSFSFIPRFWSSRSCLTLIELSLICSPLFSFGWVGPHIVYVEKVFDVGSGPEEGLLGLRSEDMFCCWVLRPEEMIGSKSCCTIERTSALHAGRSKSVGCWLWGDPRNIHSCHSCQLQ